MTENKLLILHVGKSVFGCHLSFSAIMKKPYAAAWAQIYAISGHGESVKETGFTSIIRERKVVSSEFIMAVNPEKPTSVCCTSPKALP